MIFVLGLALFPMLGPSTAAADPPRVPADYFGADFDFNVFGSSNVDYQYLDRAMAKMAEAGITNARMTFSWAEMEPKAPVGGSHGYVFQNFDRWVSIAAAHGVRLQPVFAYTPRWATGSNFCVDFTGGHSASPTNMPAWRQAISAFERRYGRSGTYWSERPTLQSLPMKRYEIWNEPNLNYYWCPTPQPETYAEYLSAAEQELSSIDPAVEVISGGLPLTSGRAPNSAVEPRYFWKAMFKQVPSLKSRLAGIGIHAYAFVPIAKQLDVIAEFRKQLREAGGPDSLPMTITETGWPSQGSKYSVAEPERSQRYYDYATQVPRTNCNVNGIDVYNWISRSQAASNFDDWFGLINPSSLQLYPAGTAFSTAIRQVRGELGQAGLARQTIDLCPGMPKPDQDGDGIPDENDGYPLDGSLPVTGPGDPGGSGGSGGSGSSGAGPAGKSATCSSRLVHLAEKVVHSNGKQHRRYLRKYRRTERRCIPCKRRLARLHSKIGHADGQKKRHLKRKARRVRRKCVACNTRLQRLQLRAASAKDPLARARIEKRLEHARKRCTAKD